PGWLTHCRKVTTTPSPSDTTSSGNVSAILDRPPEPFSVVHPKCDPDLSKFRARRQTLSEFPTCGLAAETRTFCQCATPGPNPLPDTERGRMTTTISSPPLR